MHPQPKSGSGTRESIPKVTGKLPEARAANVIPKHPSHGNIFSFSKHHSGKELMNERNVVVLINLHERVKPKLLRDPKSLLKISMPVEM
jgi:hypothetical protein